MLLLLKKVLLFLQITDQQCHCQRCELLNLNSLCFYLFLIARPAGVMPFTVSCRHILDGHFNHDSVLEAIEFNGIILMRFTSCLLLFILIIKNKHRACREDGRRAMLLVLPSYYPAICGAILYYFVFAMLHIFIYGYSRYIVLVALDVAINHAMSIGLTFFLMQHGAGVYAFQRSLLCAICFGILAFFVFYFMLRKSGSKDDFELIQRTYLAHIMFSCLILCFYSMVVLLPEKCQYRRPAIYKYAKYCIVENIVWILASSLVHADHVTGYCTVLSGKIIFIAILHPLFFVHCLAKDSEVCNAVSANVSKQQTHV